MKDSFDPTKYLRKLQGQDYLEVKWRLVWLRSEHPDAEIETELIRLDMDEPGVKKSAKNCAVFKATVSLQTGARATGFGSEQGSDFNDYIEKAETKAVGRALGALGYGTQFSGFDFEEGTRPDGTPNLADSPVQAPLLSIEQRETIITLSKSRFTSNDDFKAMLKERYDTTGIKELYSDQAADFITWLKTPVVTDEEKPF